MISDKIPTKNVVPDDRFQPELTKMVIMAAIIPAEIENAIILIINVRTMNSAFFICV